MDDMAKEDEKKETGEWKEFFWNPRTHELLGRTASSWGECSPVYNIMMCVFFFFLTGCGLLSAITCLWALLITISLSAGMMIRPKGDQLEIVYNVQKTESWDTYVQALDNFLAPYNDSQQVMKNDACIPDQYFIQEDSGEVRNNPKRSCQFNRTMLEECSGLSDHTYGYQDKKPCVLIKLNRVIGMLPGEKGKSPYVTCRAREDSDNIGPIAYFPPNGSFNLMYYPYYGKRAQVNYSQPLVAVKFMNLTLNTDVNVECTINSNSNITQFKISERDKFAGRVIFKLRINTM
uniref:Sodium/potassium-transporting ATPase subunit beta n=1 Tax=Cyprinus carpio TaxID=7962 RepID=A0A8C1MA04_CYPCA